jgi:hypothetical protein
MQVCVFQQQKLVSIREKSKHTSKEGFESTEIQKKQKKIYTEGASENLMQQIPWDTERKWENPI